MGLDGLDARGPVVDSDNDLATRGTTIQPLFDGLDLRGIAQTETDDRDFARLARTQLIESKAARVKMSRQLVGQACHPTAARHESDFFRRRVRHGQSGALSYGRGVGGVPFAGLYAIDILSGSFVYKSALTSGRLR